MSTEKTAPSKWYRLIVRLPDLLTDLLPLLVPIVVFVTFFIFYNTLLFCSSTNPCTPLTAAEIASGISNLDQTRAAIYVARASWALINGVHILACCAAIVTAGIVIYTALPKADYSVPMKWMLIFIVVVAAADFSILVAIWASGDVSSPAQTLLRPTVGQMVPWINRYNRLVDALSLTGTLTMAVAACATIWRHDATDETEAQLKQRVNLLKPVLYVSAATLAIGVLKISATHGWAASYLPPESEIGKSVISLVRGIVASMGTLFTLLIAGLYVPAALLLRARIRKLATREQPADPDGWLASHGLTLSFSQSVRSVVALLGPLLAGPLGELIGQAASTLTG